MIEIPKCNACKVGRLTMLAIKAVTFEGPGVTFECDKCGQWVAVYKSGRTSQTILPTLWPSNPVGAAINHAMADDFDLQQKFFADLRLICGYSTWKEWNERYAEVNAEVAKHKKEHPYSIRERLARFFGYERTKV